MLEAGYSWQRNFAAAPEQAWHVRSWTCAHLKDEDAPLIANELFLAVLATRSATVQMTVSTAGRRARITATGTARLPLHGIDLPGRRIVQGLSLGNGATADDCGIWAEFLQETDR